MNNMFHMIQEFQVKLKIYNRVIKKQQLEILLYSPFEKCKTEIKTVKKLIQEFTRRLLFYLPIH